MLENLLDLLQRTETCALVENSNSLSNKLLKEFDVVIRIETEITFEDRLKEIILYVALNKNLDVHLPKIFIDKGSYEELKFVPHVNSDLSICIIDESENYYYEGEDVPQIVVYLVEKAKAILRSKEDLDYTLEEFTREFQAYWLIQYSRKDQVWPIGLSLIDKNSSEELKAIKLKKGLGHYSFLLYNSIEEFSRFETYLKNNKIEYQDIPVFQVLFEKQTPSFEISYFDSLKCIEDHKEVTQFKSAINCSKGKDLLCVFNNRQNEFYGWIYPHFNILPTGSRRKSNWEKLKLNHAKNFSVERISFSDFSQNRLLLRTSGEISDKKSVFNIIGLGSVGSNLMHFLSRLPVSSYNLVDNDIYKIENLYRHNYGLSSMSKPKVQIAKQKLLDSDPYLEVNSFQEDIVNLIKKNQNFFETADYSFLVIGVTRIEKFILNWLIMNGCKKSIFILWVEPYLASGQMLYVTPDKFAEAIDLLSNFPVKVLTEDNKLFFKEGSCQSGYYPYSETYLTMFLSCIFPSIYEIIIGDKGKNSMIFSWIGDINYLKSKGLEINEQYLDKSFSLLIDKL